MAIEKQVAHSRSDTQANARVGLTVDHGCLMVADRPRPRYTLDKLLAEAQESSVYPLPPEKREWIDTPAFGKELS